MATSSGLRTRWAAVGAAVAITLGAAGIGSLNIANADVSSGDRPVFIPINPCRLVDTRPGDLTVGPRAAPLTAEETVTVTAHGTNGECTGASTIPTDALSLSLNVTAVGPTSNTFLTFWGDGPNPGTSNLNPRAGGAPTPNSVNTPLSPAGTFNIFNNRGNVNVIVDVNGYYANHNHDDRYVPLPTEIAVHPNDFVPVGGSGNDWSWQFGTLDHAFGGGFDCATAPVDLPAGHDVTGVELVYQAEGDNNGVTIDVEGLVRQSGEEPIATLRQEVATFAGDLPETFPFGAVVGSIDVDGVDLTLQADATAIDTTKYHYRVEVCTPDSLLVHGVNVTVAPTT